MNSQRVSLATLAGGAAVELWDRELDKVLENIVDPNTDPQSKRVITLRVTIKPDENRDVAAAMIDVTSSVAHNKPHGTLVYIGREQRGGPVVALERNQRELWSEREQPADDVLQLEPRKGAAE